MSAYEILDLLLKFILVGLVFIIIRNLHSNKNKEMPKR